MGTGRVASLAPCYPRGSVLAIPVVLGSVTSLLHKTVRMHSAKVKMFQADARNSEAIGRLELGPISRMSI
jgi:hypothetical protein